MGLHLYTQLSKVFAKVYPRHSCHRCVYKLKIFSEVWLFSFLSGTRWVSCLFTWPHPNFMHNMPRPKRLMGDTKKRRLRTRLPRTTTVWSGEGWCFLYLKYTGVLAIKVGSLFITFDLSGSIWTTFRILKRPSELWRRHSPLMEPKWWPGLLPCSIFLCLFNLF